MLSDWALLLPKSRNTFSSEHVGVLKTKNQKNQKKPKKKDVFWC